MKTEKEAREKAIIIKME